MRRSLVAALGFLPAATSCGGDSRPGVQFKESDLALYPYGGQTDRHAHGTCPRGRLSVEFEPRKEITISYDSACRIALLSGRVPSRARTHESFEPPRGVGWFFPPGGFARTNRPTTLVCLAGKRIDIRVHAVYKYESVGASSRWSSRRQAARGESLSSRPISRRTGSPFCTTTPLGVRSCGTARDQVLQPHRR
jgi:hypothetical protein